MSQNYFYNRNGYYDKSSYRPDIDNFCLDNYPARMTSSSTACGAASDLSYRRDLVRLRQKLEERHNRIMQEKAAFQMFNEFKENFFKTYGDASISTSTSIPVQSQQPQLLNLQTFPEKESYGISSAYSSNVNLTSPVLSTPTVLAPPVYYPPLQNVPRQIPTIPTTSISEECGYDTTTASIVKYIEHIHNLESEKEVFETVVKALIEYQKRKTAKTNASNIKLIPEEISSTKPSKNQDLESFKEEYLKKLDDVKSVAQDIKESVADFRQQLLCQKQQQHNEMGDKEVLTPVRDCNPIDNDGDVVTESKMTNNSSKSYNSKGGTVLNNIDYTLYENGMNGVTNSTPITYGGCRKKDEKISKSESERIPASNFNDNDVKATITNEKCETCHGYLMQKKFHDNLKHFDDTTNETVHFSSAERQFAEQTPECKCIKDENAHEQNGDKINQIDDDENIVTKESQTILYPLMVKSKSDQCMKHWEPEKLRIVEHSKHQKQSVCCLHKISSTNQVSHQCASKQYSTSKCYFEESKVVKCVVQQHNTTITSDDVIETTEDPIDADTIVSYFVKRVKDLKDQCRRYRSMKDVLQKRVEEYSGIYTKENSLVC
ncbi:uncharacterized protein LOC123305081 [Chrysoperla carnea]|uniref:uncharacterized protein LOC123305081 n=1 Tax=Chrysoperla carnea TaxID=189513 RepID=UPI001D05FE1B|nr:uncharacterized protein LOC123305081 [Chrysoperla carnea]